MEKSDFKENHIAVIRRFVQSPEFLEIKDAFVSHTPERGSEGRDGDSDSKNLGRLLGTRYVFNQLNTIAQSPPPRSQANNNNRSRQQSRVEQDPDMET